jgi:hypothetical protein
MDILSCQAFIRFTGATPIEGFISRNRNRCGRAELCRGCDAIEWPFVVMTVNHKPT